jgi:hypothetical protein
MAQAVIVLVVVVGLPLSPYSLAGFCTHFPDYGKSKVQTATHQHKVLQEMLQATIRAKMEYTNIRTINSEAIGTSQAFSA